MGVPARIIRIFRLVCVLLGYVLFFVDLDFRGDLCVVLLVFGFGVFCSENAALGQH